MSGHSSLDPSTSVPAAVESELTHNESVNGNQSSKSSLRTFPASLDG